MKIKMETLTVLLLATLLTSCAPGRISELRDNPGYRLEYAVDLPLERAHKIANQQATLCHTRTSTMLISSTQTTVMNDLDAKGGYVTVVMHGVHGPGYLMLIDLYPVSDDKTRIIVSHGTAWDWYAAAVKDWFTGSDRCEKDPKIN